MISGDYFRKLQPGFQQVAIPTDHLCIITHWHNEPQGASSGHQAWQLQLRVPHSKQGDFMIFPNTSEKDINALAYY